MALPLYESQTSSSAISELPARLRSALILHADAQKIHLVNSRTWLTHRKNPVAKGVIGKLLGRRSNSADPDAEHHMVLVLHETHVLIGSYGAERGASILSLLKTSASVSRGTESGAALGEKMDLPSDDGLTIHGFPSVEGRLGSCFFGLGPGQHAEECVALVLAALTPRPN